MSERDVVEATPEPATVGSLVRDLRALGVTTGTTLVVHSSLAAVGWVVGGAHAVVLALGEAVGSEGTLVMPSHSTDLSEPSHWENPPVPETWWQTIRTEMPAFDPRVTPTRAMGVIADTFRAQEGTIRSHHPHSSFTARGPLAGEITRDHALDSGLGERSPLARLYELDARVLLLGVGHDRNTSLHLCEYRAEFPSKKTMRQGAPVLVDGVRRWAEFEDLDWDEGDFAALGAAFEQEPDAVRRGRVGTGEARLMRQRALVDFGVDWMTLHRPRPN